LTRLTRRRRTRCTGRLTASSPTRSTLSASTVRGGRESEAAGDTERAIALLADARARSNRLAEPYLWLDGYILDAQCDLGRRHGHPDTGVWIETLRNLASRSGMRELTLRSLQHGAALGRAGDGAAAAALADELAEFR
jgi:hypothetical protein